MSLISGPLSLGYCLLQLHHQSLLGQCPIHPEILWMHQVFHGMKGDRDKGGSRLFLLGLVYWL